MLLYTTGKTANIDNKQLSRCTRHKMVLQCPIGALAMYLFVRFDESSEMIGLPSRNLPKPEFLYNNTWFSYKLCTDAVSKVVNIEKGIGNKSFSDAINKSFATLNISSRHKLHYGRVQGPTHLEMKRVSPDLIRVLVSTICNILNFVTYAHILNLNFT